MAGSVVGKLAFITGAGSGIGRAACQVLAREGAVIVAADRNAKTAEETINLLDKPTDSTHISVGVDVANSKSVKDALQRTLDTFNKPPTIVVNCAGITRDNFLLKLSEENFDEVIDVNLKGTFLVMQTFGNALVTRGITGGSFVNIASIVGKYGNVGQANYSASKAGVELLTKTACKEFGKLGIRVNSILPGFIETPMLGAVPDKVKEKFMNLVPMGRTGKPEEIAEVIAFLASDKSSYVSGASIEVTGGF